MENEFKKWLREIALSLPHVVPTTATVSTDTSMEDEMDDLLFQSGTQQRIFQEQQRLAQEQALRDQQQFMDQVMQQQMIDQQIMDQVTQQQFMDFSFQSSTPMDQGGFLPPIFP